MLVGRAVTTGVLFYSRSKFPKQKHHADIHAHHAITNLRIALCGLSSDEFDTLIHHVNASNTAPVFDSRVQEIYADTFDKHESEYNLAAERDATTLYQQ